MHTILGAHHNLIPLSGLARAVRHQISLIHPSTVPLEGSGTEEPILLIGFDSNHPWMLRTSLLLRKTSITALARWLRMLLVLSTLM